MLRKPLLAPLAGAAVLFACVGCAVNPPPTAVPEGARWTLQPGQHGQAVQKQVTRTVQARFLVYLPKGYDDGRKWPLLVFLHGSGERGSDLADVKRNGPPKIVESRPDFPFIVVSPQAEQDREFDPDTLDVMLDEVLRQLPVDPDRVYLTGLSMGGIGTWAWASSRPDRFAAIAPVCGAWQPQDACKLKSLPIWAFHGARDEVVPIKAEQDMVEAVNACGGQARFTVYEDGGHDVWTATYDSQQLYDWLLQQRRGAGAPAQATR